MVRQKLVSERLQLTLEGWGPLGSTLAWYDGRQVQVLGGIPGEQVVVEVLKDRGEQLSGQVVEVLMPSPHRVSAPCPYYGPCTGCQWQHIEYQHQLETKNQIVLDALGQVGGFTGPPVLPTLASPDQYGYRNHARFTVGRKWGELGYVNRESRRFVTVQSCLLMHPWINQAIQQLQRRSAETSQLSLRYGVNTGDFLLQPAFKSQDVPLPSGQKHYRESLGGQEFRIAASSFFQVNTRQAERMVELVEEGLQLSGRELLVDAYAGVGTFAILLAPRARKVIAIEESVSAVRDAEFNAQGMEGVEFVLGKTEVVLAEMQERPDGVILDPPRAGCDKKALDAVIRLAPRRVVYVSCDPASLARDLKVLCEGPFRLESVQPMDMFPQTHHVECVANLSYEEPAVGNGLAGPIVLASTSPRRKELLAGLGLEFRIIAPEVSEEMLPGEDPQQMVERLALAKAKSVASTVDQGLIVGADSIVVLDGRVLGKPAGATEAREMLNALRGREHQVMTGVAVADGSVGSVRVASKVSGVTMREYSDNEIEDYIASGEPMDKAGAYAVQDRDFRPGVVAEGCYANVMGLPICLLLELLKEAGYTVGPNVAVGVPEECSECSLRVS